MKFMQDAFGATGRLKHMRDEHIIAHAEINVGGSVIMPADCTDEYKPRTGGFFFYAAHADEVHQKALAADYTAVSPMADMPCGRSGGIPDPFGNTWWVTTDTKPETPEGDSL
jgi:PhnB protein